MGHGAMQHTEAGKSLALAGASRTTQEAGKVLAVGGRTPAARRHRHQPPARGSRTACPTKLGDLAAVVTAGPPLTEEDLLAELGV